MKRRSCVTPAGPTSPTRPLPPAQQLPPPPPPAPRAATARARLRAARTALHPLLCRRRSLRYPALPPPGTDSGTRHSEWTRGWAYRNLRLSSKVPDGARKHCLFAVWHRWSFCMHPCVWGADIAPSQRMSSLSFFRGMSSSSQGPAPVCVGGSAHLPVHSEDSPAGPSVFGLSVQSVPWAVQRFSPASSATLFRKPPLPQGNNSYDTTAIY